MATTELERGPFEAESARHDVDGASDEFAAIAAATVDDETIEAEIFDVEELDDGRIRLTALLPDGSKPSGVFKRPIPWSMEFPIARLVNQRGYTPSSYAELVGDPIRLRATNELGETPTEGDWAFVVPERERSAAQKLKNGLGNANAFRHSVVLVVWPLILLYTAYTLGPVSVLVLFSLVLIGFAVIAEEREDD